MIHSIIALLASIGLIGLLGGEVLAQPREIYRDGFAGRTTSFVQGEANIQFTEKDHSISAEHNKSAPTSEYIKIDARSTPGATSLPYVDYYYKTPPAPIDAALRASVWVKAYREGIQVKARLVFPKERDPNNPDAALTSIIAGDRYNSPRRWQQLGFGNLEKAVNDHLLIVRSRLKRELDTTGAYIDRIIVNTFAGDGISEVWLDDLEIGPVFSETIPDRKRSDNSVMPVGRNKNARKVEYGDSQILVENDKGKLEPFFMLAIRHSDTPLKTLRDAMLNTVWFSGQVPDTVMEEAIRHGFWIVPELPLPAGEWENKVPKEKQDQTLAEDTARIAPFLRQFLSSDAVLMWSFGGGRTAEELPKVARATEIVRRFDPRRPRAIDIWDGFSSYSTYVDAVGAHRWPLFTSFDFFNYKLWLEQRRALIPPGTLFWTWIQTHAPAWYEQLCFGEIPTETLSMPIGPHPEQIRILTYLGLASGCRGIGYWSDRYLTNNYYGRDRLLEIALLNAEIELLKPILTAAQEPARWILTSNDYVQAAIIRGPKEILVLPVWLGNNAQYAPPLAAVAQLKVTVPLVPDGATPWIITPAYVTEIKDTKRVPGGVEIIIPDFDVTAAVVFTTDLGIDGKVVKWQDETRFRLGENAARWSQQLAVEQYNKCLATHKRILEAGGPELIEAAELLQRARLMIDQAKQYADNRQYDVAYREARRALQPIRTLMRADWERATASLDTPSASPYAISFYSLPKHWELAREVAESQLGANVFAHGGFELSRPAPKGGATVESLPGWKVRTSIIDEVIPIARIINLDEDDIADEPIEKPLQLSTRYSPVHIPQQPDLLRLPNFGHTVLKLVLAPDYLLNRKGEEIAPSQAIERAVLAVDSPATVLPAGSVVRISFWIKVFVGATADGLVVFDSVGGEPLGVRAQYQPTWKQYHLYRRVPASGQINMTFALTGAGKAYIDDVRIEPLTAPFRTAQQP